MDTILDTLNEEQQKAVVCTEGYVRVVAGAGTGKTKALTHRYAYIVRELGISAANILCVTFTNKAANEMKRRVKRMLGEQYDTSFVATIHSFCVRVLREDIGKLFYPASFVVLDNADRKKILEEIYDEMGLHMDSANFNSVIDMIEAYKDPLGYLNFVTDPNYDFKEKKPKSRNEAIIYRYIEKQKKYFALDFVDIINFTQYLLQKHADVLEKWQNRLHYIQIDEFQDVTYREFLLMQMLSGINQNLFVVGDPDQNVYEWRGSDMKIILDFATQMRPCTDVIMSRNYRSSPEILAASNALIAKNRNRIKKELFTENTPQGKPVHFHAKSDKDEIKYITDKIIEHTASGGSLNDLAIMYRSNYVSRFVEQGLLQANIPYIVYGGVGFYERMEIKDVLSYMRLVASGDDLSFLRIVNVPRRKIGKIKLGYVKGIAERENCTYYEAMKRHCDNPIFSGCKAKEFIEAIEHLREFLEELSVSELLQRILIETEYEAYIRESGDMDRLDNITELLRSIVLQENEFGEHLSLSMFLQNISLIKDVESEEKDDKIRIMTIHTAKGLEFDTVFIAGMSDGTMPSARALESRQNEALEEERRLCFVAMTRAKRKLYLSESEGFALRGTTKIPSRFLFDIDDGCLERIGNIPEEFKIDYQQKTLNTAPPTDDLFIVGARVNHRIFGDGVIESIDTATRTYLIKFRHNVKPISFDFKGLSTVK